MIELLQHYYFVIILSGSISYQLYSLLLHVQVLKEVELYQQVPSSLCLVNAYCTFCNKNEVSNKSTCADSMSYNVKACHTEKQYIKYIFD